MNWASQSACRDADPDLFFPAGDADLVGIAISKAKDVCATCPVTEQCLDFALESNERVGVWGGLSPVERTSVARRVRAVAAVHR